VRNTSSEHSPIYIGTILLERNRWQPGKQPSYRVSDWIERFQAAGFDGMELWENHALLGLADERAALAAARFPIAVFNSYAAFDDGAAEQRTAAASLVRHLQARAVKFNLGSDLALYPTYINHLHTWRASIPDNVRLLCECHRGTVVETPAMASHMLRHIAPGRIEAIIHPFTMHPDTLRAWFDALGGTITHAHVQLHNADGLFVRLERRLYTVRNALHVMRTYGFRGSFTIEFTEGVGASREDQDALFAAAVADLHVLKEYWG
jgi:sugar phosphate isomerase/epimerase